MVGTFIGILLSLLMRGGFILVGAEIIERFSWVFYLFGAFLLYTALQLVGRDVYVREGCYNCHSQMIRPLHAETLRYGQRIGVLALPSPPALRTATALAQVGPRAFGYDFDWRPIFDEGPA